ncbi:site-specific integrase [Magnetospirillum sp. XM-1]|uniref:site-specific integrase n=1 Tax=Magnetospirillum sp. XM-1 TaxID=1663591 RepID=UPI000838F859|nr:site-specific integrase [Magnetospirillum sp. XM-1]
MKAAINHAIKHRRLASTDAPIIELPAKAPPRDKWLDEEQEADLLAKLEALTAREGRVNRVHLFTAIALNTASRKRAIETLRWAKVDLDARLIDFRDATIQKTKKRRVPVPISDRLLPLLVRARQENPDGEFVLGNTSFISHAFEAAMKKLGYPWVTPHVLRHTWGTLAARAGKDMFEIAGVMGDNVTTVQANYLHHHSDHLRSAVERGKIRA